MFLLILIYLLTAVGLTPGVSSTVHIYTQTIHTTTQLITLIGRLPGIRPQNGQTDWEECGPCPVFTSTYPGAFALHLRKKFPFAYSCIHGIVLIMAHTVGRCSSVGITTDYGLDGPGIESRWGGVSFPGVKRGRGVLLTTHPLLAPRSWKSRAIYLPPSGPQLGL
jgi:hypothetical protein